jgi:hypothetical protein
MQARLRARRQSGVSYAWGSGVENECRPERKTGKGGLVTG